MLDSWSVLALGQATGRPTSGSPFPGLIFRAAMEHGLREEPW